jgi:hypothetical protein
MFRIFFRQLTLWAVLVAVQNVHPQRFFQIVKSELQIKGSISAEPTHVPAVQTIQSVVFTWIMAGEV